MEEEAAAPQKQRPGRPTKPREDVDGTRPTNITVPVTLFKKIAHARESKGVSTGELIAIAIETHFDELPALLAASNRPPPLRAACSALAPAVCRVAVTSRSGPSPTA